MRIYPIAKDAMCTLCIKKRETILAAVIDTANLTHNRYQSALWKEYIDACNHCDEYGKDPLPWCELGANR